jgi:hypothetical protein
MTSVMTGGISSAGKTVAAGTSGSDATGSVRNTLTSDSKGGTSTAAFGTVTFSTTGALTVGLGTGAAPGANAKSTMATAFAGGNALTLDANDSFAFNVAVNGASAKRVPVNKT